MIGNDFLIIKLFFAFQHMVKMSFDVVKRWVNEAQEAASSDNIMVQVGRMLHLMSCILTVCVPIIQ